MNAEIKYNGYTAQPSDYECLDGDLAASLNLISENSQIKPLPQPVPILTLQENEKVLFIHNVPNQKNYILTRSGAGNSVDIFWLKKEPGLINTDNARFLAAVQGLLDMTAVGNTLIFALSEALRYVLWNGEDYKTLGSRPPFISIDFGMAKVGKLNNTKEVNLPHFCNSLWAINGDPMKKELGELTQTVYGLLNPAIADKVTSKGYFYQPCFVRYAYRLYDGTYSWHSAPILLLPTILPPLIRHTDPDTGHGLSGSKNITMSLDVNYFSLYYRILTGSVAELDSWSDIISCIDVFVTAPIYTYDQSKDLPSHPFTRIDGILKSLYYRDADSIGDGRLPPSASIFVGHYADAKGEDSNKYIDHTMSSSDDTYHYVNIQLHPQFHDNICDAHDFYKIAEIDIKKIKAMAEMSPLKLLDDDLSSLVTKPVLSDDYQSHFPITASSLYAFNSRLNLSGVKIAPPEPFPLRSCTEFSNPDGVAASRVRIKVWTRLNGVKCTAVHNGQSSAETDVFFSPETNFPRYIYYPDASAYKMEIYVSDTLKYTIPLKQHDFLNGAYYCCTQFKSDTSPEQVESEADGGATSVCVDSKIYTSEVNNPFVFPVLGINTVGSGEIYGICSAAKALSQGQFGQFPLYAFTSEGVWALETTATGTYSARQPITRDVCINPAAITQIDSAVLFPTARGIMLISGSQVQCMTDSINSDTPFDITALPAMNKLHAMLGHDDATCFPTAPFLEFLAGCGMVYDYVHQHIIVYSPNYTYAYVFSLKSQQWGMTYSAIDSVVNSYPEALAIDKNHNLVDFTQGNRGDVPGLLLTRPLKLDAANIHKTVDNIIQRGNFRKGHVQSVLYGSRDLMNWHLVWSSKDHYLRGFRGTPYKYFRIALLCNLSPDESIFGASVQFTPRLTNQPR